MLIFFREYLECLYYCEGLRLGDEKVDKALPSVKVKPAPQSSLQDASACWGDQLP